MQMFDFTLNRKSVRWMAFNLVEQLNIKNTFNKEKRIVAYDDKRCSWSDILSQWTKIRRSLFAVRGQGEQQWQLSLNF